MTPLKGPSETNKGIVRAFDLLCKKMPARSWLSIQGARMRTGEVTEDYLHRAMKQAILAPTVAFRPYVHVGLNVQVPRVFEAHDVYETVTKFKRAMLGIMVASDPMHPNRIVDVTDDPRAPKNMRGRFHVRRGFSISLWTQVFGPDERKVCDIYCTFKRRP
jgi:hypothetical protein